MTFDDAVRLISKERERQQRLHGHENHLWEEDGIKLAVLTEETGEVARALLDSRTCHKHDRERMAAELRDELVQVAAVAIKWLESMP